MRWQENWPRAISPDLSESRAAACVETHLEPSCLILVFDPNHFDDDELGASITQRSSKRGVTNSLHLPRLVIQQPQRLLERPGVVIRGSQLAP